MKVIAFSGRARVGKSHITTTLARALWDSGNYVPVVLPLALPLKRAAAEAGFAKDEDPTGYRAYCQEHGAAKREANADHWLELWHSMFLDTAMRELGSSREFVVIVDDVRYQNELTLIGNMSDSKTIFVDEGSRSGTLEDDNAEWRNHHSEYLANEAHDDWNHWSGSFDFLFRNDGDAYTDLLEYITAGDDCGKVIEAWLGNHDCPCAFCDSHIQNIALDEAALIAEMNDALGNVTVDVDDDDESDDYDDMAAINRTIGELFGMEDVDIEDILEKLDDEEDEEADDEDS